MSSPARFVENRVRWMTFVLAQQCGAWQGLHDSPYSIENDDKRPFVDKCVQRKRVIERLCDEMPFLVLHDSDTRIARAGVGR